MYSALKHCRITHVVQSILYSQLLWNNSRRKYYTLTLNCCRITHVVHGPGEVEAQVGRSEADNGQLADAAVLKLRLSQEVEGDEARETDGVESDVA